jgi:hypothetical protein
MLHMHFGAGRLGLGLVAPYFRTPESELFLLNRAVSGANPTGSTSLAPTRRNHLLATHPRREYVIEAPGCCAGERPQARVTYDGFFDYQADVAGVVRDILERSRQKARGVIVTASVVSEGNYPPVIQALNAICREKESRGAEIGDVYLVACENTVSAGQVMDASDQVEDATGKHVRCVPALVDRVCADLEECDDDGQPTVRVRAEPYGALKLQLCDRTRDLPALLAGSRVGFSRYLNTEKEIKGWMLNGSHWLIALTAFQEVGGDTTLMLNEFIDGTHSHRLYATEVIHEMRDGVDAVLRTDPQYAGFVRDVDVKAYLDAYENAIFDRFRVNADSITRILARFRAPSAENLMSVQSFVSRFLQRIDVPLLAYLDRYGMPPRSATKGIFNLVRLQASGRYVNTGTAGLGAAA